MISLKEEDEYDKEKRINWLGLLGVASFLSYLIAVLFAPLAYPRL